MFSFSATFLIFCLFSLDMSFHFFFAFSIFFSFCYVFPLFRHAPRLACSLIRRTFRSPVVTTDLCHMQWHGASRSALHPHDARSQWRAHFSSSPTGDSVFPTTTSTRSPSTSGLSHPFTSQADYNELVAALFKCHESAPGALLDLSHGGVIFCSLSSTSSCASLLFRQLGSPAWLFWSSSAMVTPLLLTPIVPFLSPFALSKFSSTSSMLALGPHPSTTGRLGLQSRGLLAPLPP